MILLKSAQKDDMMEQRLIAQMFGARNSTVKAEPVLRSELMKWDYTGIGGSAARRLCAAEADAAWSSDVHDLGPAQVLQAARTGLRESEETY